MRGARGFLSSLLMSAMCTGAIEWWMLGCVVPSAAAGHGASPWGWMAWVAMVSRLSIAGGALALRSLSSGPVWIFRSPPGERGARIGRWLGWTVGLAVGAMSWIRWS